MARKGVIDPVLKQTAYNINIWKKYQTKYIL